MQIYNSSEVIKVLRDIKIEFVLNEKSIITKPSNSDSGTKSAGVYKYKGFIKSRDKIEIVYMAALK
jgi:hypothetical protein